MAGKLTVEVVYAEVGKADAKIWVRPVACLRAAPGAGA
jgi:hypothetical protein